MQVKLELKIVKSNNSTVLQGWQKEGQKEQKEVTSRQLDIIHLLEETPSATMPQIAESLTITYRSVRIIFKRLELYLVRAVVKRDIGLLINEGDKLKIGNDVKAFYS